MDVDKIIKYESGGMNEHELIEFFQGLIDSGVVWKLQGSYGKMAMHLINEGICTPPKEN